MCPNLSAANIHDKAGHQDLPLSKFHPDLDGCGRKLQFADVCRCYKNVFYLVTLVYPRCAQTCLQLFSMTKLDIGTYLSSDFTIVVRDVAGHWGKIYLR